MINLKLFFKKRTFVKHFNTAVKYANSGDYKSAVRGYEEAFSLYSGYDLFWGLGKAYREVGDLSKAENILLKAIQTNPEREEAHLQLGIVYHDLEKYEDAKREYSIAIENNPQNKENYLHLGLVLGELGEYRGALESFKRAVKIDPNYKRAYFNIGIMFEIQGNFSEAISWYKNALVLTSKDKYARNEDIRKHLDKCVAKK